MPCNRRMLAMPGDTKPVAIIMGSQSDWATMRHAAETLDTLGIGYDARIVSAHRTPDRLYDFAKGAEGAGFKVVIAGAGGAAHLPGMTAALTPLPVFGVPVESKALSGVGQPPFHRPDAGRHPGRHARHRQAPARSMRRLLAAAVLALVRRGARRAARALARGPDRALSPSARRATKAARHDRARAAGRRPRHSRRRPARPHARSRRRAARAIQSHVYCPDADSPAFQVARRITVAPYEDEAALATFADAVDAITYEFENIPAPAAAFLSARRPVLPGVRALATTPDRLDREDLRARASASPRRSSSRSTSIPRSPSPSRRSAGPRS